ncbi:glycoside hydrolase superfamily [Stachybotrys elegans]|uniref:Glycoside hydrolase superfamily n=1 Tax=Stachybotrys elegans TaxID=80388 RepID=A0A8K0SJQ4_9HYPO|nr:glycoside hydrolase superfamily [Stachybotrys elegans]
MKSSAWPLIWAARIAGALRVRQTPQGSASVDLTQRTGPAEFLASGFIYGFPDNGVEADTSIPENLVTDIKFRASRAGGAQLPAPGWAVDGYDGYVGRFNSTLSNYRTTRKYGGDFILLPHDLWGADGGLGDGTYPGDDGDWTMMEEFYAQLTKDLRDNDMLPGLVFDLWNEPDIDIFWSKPWEQYLEYYVRAHEIVRRELPEVVISGPSSAGSPNLSADKWDTWMAAIAENDAIPDIYSWHQIGTWEREPDSTIPDFNALRARHGLPERPIDVNEYAWPDEQNPATSAWYISQLERHNLRGLRANWGSGSDLHDTMGDLIFRTADGYLPNGEWHMYWYYAEMTGDRVATTASSDLLFDAFGIVAGNVAKILAGTRTVQSAYEIKVSGLSALDLPTEGSVRVRTLRFDWEGNESDTGGPTDLGLSDVGYSDDTLVLLLSPPDNSTAYAYEINV